jgi:hypothetical protein
LVCAIDAVTYIHNMARVSVVFGFIVIFLVK